MKKIAKILSGSMIGLVAGTNAATTHPHVFAEARLELQAATDGTIKELRHVWRFDPLFTSTVVLEFDDDGDLKLSGDELDNVANTVASSIADFNYFQNIEVRGQDVPLKKVTEMEISIEDEQLLILFATVPALPVTLVSEPSIGVFDPTFYTAIEFYNESDMVLIDAPDGCAHKMIIPDPDEAIAQNEQSLTEAFFDPADENDFSKILATRMEVSCS